MTVYFKLSLSAVQVSLIHAMKNFLDTYSTDTLLKLSPDYLEIVSKLSSLYIKEKSTENAKPSVELRIGQINYLFDLFIPMLSNMSFGTKKYQDFLYWQFIVSLIYSGKHQTELGKELIFKISKRMNNYRLYTFNHLNNESLDITPDLINKILNSENTYIVDQNGLRVNTSNHTLVKGQLFYILAECSNGKIEIFKDTSTCADYFNTTSKTINDRLIKKSTH